MVLTLNPCGAEIEITEHFLLHCQLYSTHRSECSKYFNHESQPTVFEADCKRSSTCVVIWFTKK